MRPHAHLDEPHRALAPTQHEQPVLARLGYRRGAFPVSEAWSREVLSLPMFAELEPHEIERAGGIATAWEATAA